MTDSDSPFYLGINHTKNPTEKPLFKASAMKTMADKQALMRSKDLPTTAHGKL